MAFSSIVRVSARISTKTGVAPASRKAFAVEQKVKDGMITSSPCPIPNTRGIASSAKVQDGSQQDMTQTKLGFQHFDGARRGTAIGRDITTFADRRDAGPLFTGQEDTVEWNRSNRLDLVVV